MYEFICICLAIYCAWLKLQTLALWEQVCYWEKLHWDLNEGNKQFCIHCGKRSMRFYPTLVTINSKQCHMAECLSCGKCEPVVKDNNPLDLDVTSNNEMRPFIQYGYKTIKKRWIK